MGLVGRFLRALIGALRVEPPVCPTCGAAVKIEETTGFDVGIRRFHCGAVDEISGQFSNIVTQKEPCPHATRPGN